MKNIFRTIIFHTMIFLAAVPAASQISHSILSEQIAVTARPSIDSILLRWAPLDFKVWQSGNIHGYRIERYTLVRDGNFLSQPEKLIVHPSTKPWSEEKWESLVRNNKYAAIAAQALYGDRFEVDLKQSDIFTIVDKVRENEQRFAFALFSADISPDVARACGLWFADKQVKKGEKYLYRVVVNSMDSLRGSIYLSPDDPYELLKPQNFQAGFKDQLVSLKWDKSKDAHYTAYLVERSDDGKYFFSISESPMVTLSPTASEDTRYEYAIDSLLDFSRIYHYRVKGITPFGEVSPPSDIASGKGTLSVNHVPYISAVESKENNSLLIQWNFPETNNDAIKGFVVERASKPKENYTLLTGNILPAHSRMYEDRSPQQVNYYRVIAHGPDGELYSSQVYFAQLVDSIPPAYPAGLEGKINDSGKVHLSWTPNPEPDIFGYRIYKAYHESEELAQITTEPIPQSLFHDLVDVNTLNEAVYYRVMAVDINQNHSTLSELLKLTLPDKVNPQRPVFLPVESSADGVSLHWIPGSSEDILQYKVYRKTQGKSEWRQLKAIQNTTDTLYHYFDKDAIPGTINYYTVVAVDDAGLESEPAHPVSGSIIDAGLRPAIAWKKPLIRREQNQITLSWNYSQPRILSFRIFRGVDHHPLILFKTVPGDKKDFTDTMIPEQHYVYRIMAVFEDGNKSHLSEGMEFQY